jgi:2-succinyl-5-enolpyruvyl-6-hydroxy-3-cyclohexene-1-carboxylate synthase
MAGSLHPLVDQLVEICAARGVRDWILAPGSRSAPLTVALTRHPQLRCRLVYDERSAAYVALGMAQQLRTAVGLVCTSGTAAVNFAPAVVEAFYQGVPLLVLTADRPPEWIDQQDNQAIHQNDLYAPHVRGSFTFPLDDGKPDTRWFAARIVGKALDLAAGWEPGPVHINVPLREPLYTPPAAGEERQVPPLGAVTAPARPAAPRALASRPQLTEEAWQELLAQWQAAPRKLIVGGMHPTDVRLREALTQLAADPNVAIFADVTANLHGLACVPQHADAVLGTRDPQTLAALRPDLVVNFGGQVTSKNIKTLLRAQQEQPVRALWHVRPGQVAPDTYQALTHVVPMPPAEFFAELSARLAEIAPDAITAPTATTARGYQAAWRALDFEAETLLHDCQAVEPFNEFAAVGKILRALPEGSLLQAGNSMAIRYVNLFGVQPGRQPRQVNSNRGTSGIDGTVSTAVGAALAAAMQAAAMQTSDTQVLATQVGAADHTGLEEAAITTLIVGDLGFFYDRNGLWHRHLPANLRIVVLNNHGGGIFDIIEGPNLLERERQEAWFLTPQPLTARRTAEDHGLRYWHAANDAGLERSLAEFFARGAGPALLEIETDMGTNTAAYNRCKAALAQLRLAQTGA